MKLFQATIISNNSCYVHTLLIIDKDIESAHKQLCEQQKREVHYTHQLKELNIDFTKPNIIEYVGWGESESCYGGED